MAEGIKLALKAEVDEGKLFMAKPQHDLALDPATPSPGVDDDPVYRKKYNEMMELARAKKIQQYQREAIQR